MNGMTSEEYANYYSDKYFGYTEHIVVVVSYEEGSHHMAWYLPYGDYISYNENYNRLFDVINENLYSSAFNTVYYLCAELIEIHDEF